MNKLIYAIGDIHGMHNQLIGAMLWISNDAKMRPFTLVFLGDYCDRGPATRQVFDMLIEVDNHTFFHEDLPFVYNAVFLRGNHEDLMINGPERVWLLNGAVETINSYRNGEDDPAINIHKEWIRTRTQLMFETDDLVFVHAGLPFEELDLIRENVDDLAPVLMWTRGQFLTTTHNWGKRVVHGHTIMKEAKICDNRIGLDTGCFHTGNLTIARWEDQKAAPFIKTISGRPAPGWG